MTVFPAGNGHKQVKGCTSVNSGSRVNILVTRLQSWISWPFISYQVDLYTHETKWPLLSLSISLSVCVCLCVLVYVSFFLFLISFFSPFFSFSFPGLGLCDYRHPSLSLSTWTGFTYIWSIWQYNYIFYSHQTPSLISLRLFKVTSLPAELDAALRTPFGVLIMVSSSSCLWMVDMCPFNVASSSWLEIVGTIPGFDSSMLFLFSSPPSRLNTDPKDIISVPSGCREGRRT